MVVLSHLFYSGRKHFKNKHEFVFQSDRKDMAMELHDFTSLQTFWLNLRSRLRTKIKIPSTCPSDHFWIQPRTQCGALSLIYLVQATSMGKVESELSGSRWFQNWRSPQIAGWRRQLLFGGGGRRRRPSSSRPAATRRYRRGLVFRFHLLYVLDTSATGCSQRELAGHALFCCTFCSYVQANVLVLNFFCFVASYSRTWYLQKCFVEWNSLQKKVVQNCSLWCFLRLFQNLNPWNWGGNYSDTKGGGFFDVLFCFSGARPGNRRTLMHTKIFVIEVHQLLVKKSSEIVPCSESLLEQLLPPDWNFLDDQLFWEPFSMWRSMTNFFESQNFNVVWCHSQSQCAARSILFCWNLVSDFCWNGNSNLAFDWRDVAPSSIVNTFFTTVWLILIGLLSVKLVNIKCFCKLWSVSSDQLHTCRSISSWKDCDWSCPSFASEIFFVSRNHEWDTVAVWSEVSIVTDECFDSMFRCA